MARSPDKIPEEMVEMRRAALFRAEPLLSWPRSTFQVRV
jgi:hypothetical protein